LAVRPLRGGKFGFSHGGKIEAEDFSDLAIA
jgi:hypothetical protein